ncbi:MAG: GIY-YIG nuclease family protein [bacterium]|nr:GIY-YIG nuclease family protein [bacterium]
MYWTYVIYNEGRDAIYIGSTTNLEKRLLRHNGILNNKKKSFTSRNSGLWRVIYTEKFDSRSEAMHREKELKSYRGREFIRKFTSKD